MRNGRPRMLVRLVAVLTSGVLFTAATAEAARADTTTSPEQALALVQAVAPVPAVATGSDGDSAAVLATGGTTVDIARNETGSTSLATPGGTLRIGLPNARKGNRARRGATNAVAYPGTRELTNVVRVTPNGQAQTWAVLPGRASPTALTYRIRGASSLVVDGGGGLVAYNGSGAPFAFAPPPVAVDAAGRRVAAHFTTDGRGRVTVHAAHRRAGVRYPVAVDPLWGPLAIALITEAALGCATDAAAGILESILDDSRIRPGTQRWNDMLWKAADDCVWGAISGVVLGFLPSWIRKRIAKAIRGRIHDAIVRQVT